jgi:hypothetical protein
MKAYFTRIACKVRRGFFQDVSLFLFARPYGPDPLIEAVTRNAEPGGYFHTTL